MNVSELRKHLDGLPDDTRLFVSGYEGGVKDLAYVQQVHVKLNVNEEWYYGAHETVDRDDSYESAKFGEPDCSGLLLQ